jgi:hypothetical protein
MAFFVLPIVEHPEPRVNNLRISTLHLSTYADSRRNNRTNLRKLIQLVIPRLYVSIMFDP